MVEVERATRTVFTLDQFTVALVPVVEAPTVHSVSWLVPLAVEQRKNDTANHAVEVAILLVARARVRRELLAPPLEPSIEMTTAVSGVRVVLLSPPDVV